MHVMISKTSPDHQTMVVPSDHYLQDLTSEEQTRLLQDIAKWLETSEWQQKPELQRSRSALQETVMQLQSASNHSIEQLWRQLTQLVQSTPLFSLGLSPVVSALADYQLQDSTRHSSMVTPSLSAA